MLVQMSFSEVMRDVEWNAGIALCSKCGKEVGVLSREEVSAMMSGRYGDILCFDCEDFPPVPWGRLEVGQRRKLLKLFGLDDVVGLPVNAWGGWTNDREDTTMQLSPNFGWCLWLKTPDEGRWQLKRVRMSPAEAAQIKDAFCMLPVALRK